MSARNEAVFYDDHVDFSDIDLGRHRVVVFYGASGSGKSTCISRLLDTHRDFEGLRHARIAGGPVDWSTVDPPSERLVVIDEMLLLRDLAHVTGLLRAGHVIVAASHLPSWLTGALGAVWPLRQFATDRDPGKIERFLARRGIGFSRDVVRDYCKTYGATYTDAEIILEHCGGRDFDRAYRSFARRCDIALVRPPRALS